VCVVCLCTCLCMCLCVVYVFVCLGECICAWSDSGLGVVSESILAEWSCSSHEFVLQRVAVCCSVLQHVAVCRSVSQFVAACCSGFQRIAVCCSVLQCVVAVYYSVLQRAVLCCGVDCNVSNFSGVFVKRTVNRVTSALHIALDLVKKSPTGCENTKPYILWKEPYIL